MSPHYADLCELKTFTAQRRNAYTNIQLAVIVAELFCQT